MIRGFVVGGSPFIAGSLAFPHLRAAVADVHFLLDTGSLASVVHPKDLIRAGLDFDVDFRGARVVGGVSVGGDVTFALEEVYVQLRDDTDGRTIRYTMPIQIARPAEHNREFPSLLGMNFIDHFRFILDARNGLVELHR